MVMSTITLLNNMDKPMVYSLRSNVAELQSVVSLAPYMYTWIDELRQLEYSLFEVISSLGDPAVKVMISEMYW